MKRSTILIADDHAVVVEGLRRMLDRPEFEVVGVAHDGRALLQTAAQLQPDVIIADVAMPLLNGIDAVREIHKQPYRGRGPVTVTQTGDQTAAALSDSIYRGLE